MMQYDSTYYERYKEKNFLGLEKGERPFLYAFWIRKLKKLIKPDALILEIGCGAGYFLKRIEKKNRVISMDVSEEALKITKGKVVSPLFCANAEYLPFGNGIFSGVIAFDVIEHLKMPENMLKEAGRVMKKDGIFVFTTPNPSSLGAKLKGSAPRRIGLAPRLRLNEWYGRRDDTHINIKLVEEWRRLVQSSGFEILQDGTDTLWDIPYSKNIPYILQKLFLSPIHRVLTYVFGFFSWSLGENYVCIARKM